MCAASDDSKPHVLWSLYFNVDNSGHRDLTSAMDNIVVVSGPDELLDYDNAIAEVTDASMCCLVKVDSKQNTCMCGNAQHDGHPLVNGSHLTMRLANRLMNY